MVRDEPSSSTTSSQAVDRPLTRPEMAELRRYSHPGPHNANDFVNDYQGETSKGDKDGLG